MKLTKEEVSNLIDEWHASSDNLQLYEFLGMTKEECDKWLLEVGAFHFSFGD